MVDDACLVGFGSLSLGPWGFLILILSVLEPLKCT